MMRQFCLSLFLTLLIVGAAAAQPSTQRGDLSTSWSYIPLDDAVCSGGTPYGLFAREGTRDDLIIEFEGGGACWDTLTCVARPTFKQRVSPDDIQRGQGGIHALREDNPFRDHDMVVIPYCTGDVHIGARTATYGAESIAHVGGRNTQAALAWAYEQFNQPRSILVTGCSAGAIGASFWSRSIMRHHADVPISVLGDSAGGYRGNLSTQFEAWGTLDLIASLPDPTGYFTGKSSSEFGFVDFYAAAMLEFPQQRFGQFNFASDNVQRFFMNLGQLNLNLAAPVSYSEGLMANMAQLESTGTDFHYLIADGSEHCILPFDSFYEHQVGEISVRDWVARFASGEPISSTVCDERACNPAPHFNTGDL